MYFGFIYIVNVVINGCEFSCLTYIYIHPTMNSCPLIVKKYGKNAYLWINEVGWKWKIVEVYFIVGKNFGNLKHATVILPKFL